VLQSIDNGLNRISNVRTNVRVTIDAVEKAISITYYEYVFVALGMQHAKSTLRITLSSVICPALPDFSTLSHKRNNFLKNKLLNTKYVCFDFLYKFCPKYFSF
jgi:hypothetical protein